VPMFLGKAIGVIKIDLIIRVSMVNNKVTGMTIMLIKYYFLTKCMVCVFVDSDWIWWVSI